MYIVTGIGRDGGMYTGCMRLHNIDNRDPISYLKSGNGRVRTVPIGSPISPIVNGSTCNAKSRYEIFYMSSKNEPVPCNL